MAISLDEQAHGALDSSAGPWILVVGADGPAVALAAVRHRFAVEAPPISSIRDRLGRIVRRQPALTDTSGTRAE